MLMDLLGIGVHANEQQSSMKKNGVKLIFWQNKNQLWQPSVKISLFHYYFANKSVCFLTTFRGGMM